MKKVLRRLFILFALLLTLSTCADQPYIINEPNDFNGPPNAVALVAINYEGFNVLEYVAVMQAIQEWERVSNGNIEFRHVETWKEIEEYYGSRVPGTNRCYDIIGINSTHALDKHVQGLEDGKPMGTHVVGVTLRRSCAHSNIKLVTHRLDPTSKTFKWVVMHEIGHGLGMGHISDPRSLMYETSNRDEECNNHLCCITKSDIEAFCDDAHCDPETFSYCEPRK